MTMIGALMLGVLIGLSLGALGGGGSILTVPALVYLLGENPHMATTSSLVIVGVTAAVGAFSHARAGHVRWRVGAMFGVVGIGASFVGAQLNRLVAPNVLLLAFSALMLVAAAAMLRQSRSPARARVRQLVGVGATGGDTRQVDAAEHVIEHRRSLIDSRVAIAGLAVGFLTGFLGVGGGFVIVPALSVGLGYAMPDAVGTSLVIIAINSATALAARTGHETFHWAIIIPFILTAMLGSLAGKRIADKVPARQLTLAFAALTVLIALYVGLRSTLGA